MICSVQWSQASSSERASRGLAWVRLKSSAIGATVMGSASCNQRSTGGLKDGFIRGAEAELFQGGVQEAVRD